MGLSEDTPVTLPGHQRAESAGLGLGDSAVPESIPFEETGRVSSALYEAVQDDMTPENFLEQLADKLFEKSSNGGGGDGIDPEKTLREIKKHRWLIPIMALLFGSGGMVGSYYALKAQAAANTEKVQDIETATKAAEPKIEKNTQDIRLIKVNVGGIKTSMQEAKVQRAEIVTGIESLQQVNVDRLEKENDKLEREIRRLERNR